VSARSVSRYESVEPPEPPELPAERPTVSERSRGIALVLAFFGGVFGLHRFYLGRTQSGVWMCVTLGGCGIWYLYDIVVVAAGDFTDGEGRRVTRWELPDAGQASSADRRVSDLEDRLLGLEAQVGELAERLDFSERLLHQARERGTLPKT
jgi:hypothetical protein